MAIRPDLLGRHPETEQIIADEGKTNPTRFDAVNKGWVSITAPGIF
ncbi:MAG: hypothetical protein R3C11_06270 [Planctomycetaceae bacterium]